MNLLQIFRELRSKARKHNAFINFIAVLSIPFEASTIKVIKPISPLIIFLIVS